MKSNTKKLGHGLFAFLTILMSATSSHADDTEIFFGGAANQSVRPNVLFILDTSGSMKGYDGGSTTRLDRMKDAFTQLLAGMNNVNVGLMRFNDPGGPVIYPITDIDQTVSSGTYSGLATARVNGENSDAEQDATGAMTLDNNTLEITTRTSSGGSNTITKYVTSSADDGEETLSNGSMAFNNSASLETPVDDYNTSDLQASGVIFRSLGVPRNANILSASLFFDIYQRGNWGSIDRQAVDLRIDGELGSTIQNFGAQNISSRTKTSNSVIWPITDSPKAGRSIESEDISSVLQEMVNQATWSDTSDAAFFMQHAYNTTPSGNRNFSSYDDNGNGREDPKIVVQYEQSTTASVQTIGLRFAELDIPQGVTITSASLEFTAAGSNSDAATFNIEAETVDNSAEFSTSSSDITGRSTTSQVAWTPAAWTAGETYSTSDDGVDLAPLIQEIVDRTGWCGGNALTLILTGSGQRSAVSYDGSSSEAPVLKVEYDENTIPASPGGCVSSEQSYRIGTSSDDVEHRISNGDLSTNGSRLTLGYDSSNLQAVGLRFSNIQVAQGSTIGSAYLEFKADGSDSGSASFTIYAEDADNPSTYDYSRKPNNLSTIGTTVSWSPGSWNDNGTYTSPDISSIIQAIVNRGGWNSGNAISIIIKASSGSRDAVSYNNDASSAPRLVLRASGQVSDFEETTRDVLTDMISDLTAAGATPIVDTLYEAAMYYRGSPLQWGDTRGDNGASDSSRKYFRVSHEDSYAGGTHSLPSGCNSSNLNDTDCIGETISGSPVYISPITDQCQPNHIVLLTDGEPTRNDSQSLVRSLTGDSSCVTSGDGACGEELAHFLKNNDQSSTIINSNTVTTHTIGFNIDDPYLSDVASNGGGGYYTASSSADLLAAFQEILRTTLNIDTTFVSPGVTVNSFNRLTHRNEIYFSLFQPQETPHWPGNLKRYKVTSAGSILDANDVDAIDPSTGYFKDDAVSYWDNIQDGNNTAEGGAARQLPSYSSRKLYTYYSGSPSTSLNNSANQISVANKATIDKSMLSIDGESDNYHDNLINWIRGKDVNDVDDDNVTDEDRKQLSDPLHSAPFLVIYGGTDEEPDITIFYGDNEGILHAVDASDGEEIFAFAPEEVLSNFDTLFKNSGADDHPYGLDGEVTAWVKDGNANSIIEPENDDHVYIYVGMRRGGRNYYALDVTDRDNPKFLWKITGGSGDFTNLGQTWARPVKTKVNISGTTKDVLIFSGGYDENQDSVNIRTADSIGNSIYIVDAEDGSLIWKAGDGNSFDLNLGDMDYSIPASIRAIDTNSDGFADQMYVGDMGGQLWRFDIHNGNALASLISGGIIADLGGSTTSTARRFYHEPDVSRTIKNSSQQLSIAIGSGYHAHPLSTEVEDRFFVIHQNAAKTAPPDTNFDGTPDYVTLTESDLFDTTDNIIENGTNAQRTAALANLASSSGWYIEMEGELSSGSKDPGEKVLSSSLTFGGVIYFTSYQPSATVSADCTIAPGLSKLYAVNVNNGSPAGITSVSSGTTVDGTDTADRFSILLTSGLPPDPVHLRIRDESTGQTENLISVSTELHMAADRELTTKTHWYTE